MNQTEASRLSLSCALAGRCSGCPSINEPYAMQLESKGRRMEELFREAAVALDHMPPDCFFAVTGIDVGQLRDRTDLTLQESASGHVLGLYEINGQTVLDMARCPQMTPALESLFLRFRETLRLLKPGQLRRGSVRLRVGPDGRRGIWLDLANVDVKTLLDDGVWLRALLTEAIVEIGQRRKRLVVKDTALKLGDPVLEPWFETYLADQVRPTPLYGSIASFSQPGFRANTALVRQLVKLIASINEPVNQPTRGSRWLELFCGNGNFTLPLISLGKEVTAYELDVQAVEALNRSAKDCGYTERLRVVHADAYRKIQKSPDGALSPVTWSEFDGLLVDPPRSGLMQIIDWLAAAPLATRPPNIVYVSCFGPTLAQDAAALQNLGYRVTCAHGIDQFAQSPHCEWVVRFEKEPAK